ncbi:MAG: AbrB/MazE/SpoVT family DNA-binding domain-containing protein [Gemmatimonadota bacterium]
MSHLLQGLPLAASLRARGRVTLPKAARQQLSLTEGDRLIVVVGRNSIELVPTALVSRDHLWTLSELIRSRIDTAEADLSSGRTAVLENPRSMRAKVRWLIDDGP